MQSSRLGALNDVWVDTHHGGSRGGGNAVRSRGTIRDTGINLAEELFLKSNVGVRGAEELINRGLRGLALLDGDTRELDIRRFGNDLVEGITQTLQLCSVGVHEVLAGGRVRGRCQVVPKGLALRDHRGVHAHRRVVVTGTFYGAATGDESDTGRDESK